jgi:hypothetical protein
MHNTPVIKKNLEILKQKNNEDEQKEKEKCWKNIDQSRNKITQ